MPVTIYPADVDVNAYKGHYVQDSPDLLRACCRDEDQKSIGDRHYSSFIDIEVTPTGAEPNGFVRGVWNAYSYHHHLRLRPEDIWFSILSQLSFYVNAHAEEVRDVFVSHEGKQRIQVEMNPGSLDFGGMAVAMTHQMDNYIHDKEWKGWFLPNFTTTTDVDTATAAVLMMGTLQEYFSYGMSTICGIPSVTLLGEREDWVGILNRLDKVKELGEEPEEFAERLKIVLDWFIRSYDDPKDGDVVDFWSRILFEQKNDSGPEMLSGWITAFCLWSADGTNLGFEESGMELNGMGFHRIQTSHIPPGYVSVPVEMKKDGEEWHARMTAGSVGISLSSKEEDGDDFVGKRKASQLTKKERAALDTIQPLSGWFLYEVEKEESKGTRS